MHLAAPLSILAAIGGAATKTNAIGLLQATTGIVQGINSGSELRYRASLDEWKTRYEALSDHLTRVNDTFKTMQTAYTGMADADERAAARTRLMTQDQLEQSQLKLGNQLKLLEASNKFGAVLANQAKAVAAMDAAWTRSLMGVGLMGTGGIPEPGSPEWDQIVRTYAARARRGDYSWRVGLSRGGLGQALILAVDAEAAKPAEGQTVEEMATMPAQAKALTTSLVAGQKTLDGINVAANEFDRQAAIVRKYVPTGFAGSSPVFNHYLQYLRGQYAGDAEVNELRAALFDAGRAHVRAMTGPMSSAQLKEGAQNRADQLLNIDMNEKTILGTLDEMHQSLQSFAQANQDRVNDDIRQLQQLGTKPTGQPPAAGATTQQQQAAPRTFSSETDAEKAAAAGQIRPGDKIIVNGVSGTWH
jgi:hypothetical protein